MPALAKDPAHLKDRRPQRTAPATLLPLGGFDGPHPEPPPGLGDVLVGAYVELWRSPAAAAWLDSDGALVVEVVELRHLCAETRRAGKHPPGPSMSRLGALEDRLGLSPRARTANRWKVVDNAVDETAAATVADDLPDDVAVKLRDMGIDV